MRLPCAAPLLLIILAATTAGASVTLYLDGGVVETVAKGVKGRAEVQIPSSCRPDSARVRPVGNGTIARVELVPVPQSPRGAAEVSRLEERSAALRDRLKALESREEIFLAAAKSQSGKAPRRTKTNPEPLLTIRQGTEYALGQLEEVYRLRRRAERELKGVVERLTAARAAAGAGATKANIRVTPANAAVAVTCIDPDLRWTPRYDLRAADARPAGLALFAVIPETAQRMKASIVPSTLADPSPPRAVRASGAETLLSRYSVPVEAVEPNPAPPATVSFSLQLPALLPSGDAACFWNGDYLGAVSLPGGKAGENRRVSCGKR